MSSRLGILRSDDHGGQRAMNSAQNYADIFRKNRSWISLRVQPGKNFVRAATACFT